METFKKLIEQKIRLSCAILAIGIVLQTTTGLAAARHGDFCAKNGPYWRAKFMLPKITAELGRGNYELANIDLDKALVIYGDNYPIYRNGNTKDDTGLALIAANIIIKDNYSPKFGRNRIDNMRMATTLKINILINRMNLSMNCR